MKTIAIEPVLDVPQPRRSDAFGNISRLLAFLAPATGRSFAVLETVGFMAVVLAFTWWLNRTDPLLLHSGFPWLWFAPLVIALRYGTLLGVGAGAILLGVWPIAYGPDTAWPTLYFAGGLIQTIIAGHFGDIWGTRTARARSINDYLSDRLVAITNSHYLMRLSHERLEKDLLSKPTTLRDSIMELRRLSVTRAAPDDAHTRSTGAARLSGAASLLEFVAQACQIDVAALYPMHDQKLDMQPVAHVGDRFELDKKDALVTHALATLRVAHLKTEDAPGADSAYVACAPMLSADNELLALLVIKRMPFLSLNFDNLQLLLVLLGYYADGVEHSTHVQGVLDVVPDCPYEFALEIGRLTRLQHSTGLESSMVALSFQRDEIHDSLFEHVMRRRRSLDVIWPIQTHERSMLIKLMPVTDESGIDGYIARIEASLVAQFDIDLEQAGVGVHTLHLRGMAPGPALASLIKRAHPHG